MVCGKWLALVMAVVVVVVAEGRSDCTYQPTKPNAPSQPDVADQYTAKTEHVNSVKDDNEVPFTLVRYDEWVYDGPNNRIAIKTKAEYVTMIHRLDWVTKEMLEITAHEDGRFEDCIVRPVTEAVEKFFPVIFGAGLALSLDQMPEPFVPLGILNWTIPEYKGKFYRRDISSYRWEWCGLTEYEAEMGSTMISMASYWSDPSWSMPIYTGGNLSLPLGFEVIQWGADVTDYYAPLRTSIMYYEPGIVDESAFRIPSDVNCPDMIPHSGHPFPDLSQDYFFSFSVELLDIDARTSVWADAWYDFEKKLYRVDHDTTLPTSTFSKSKSSNTTIVTTTLLLDYNDGVAFEFVPGGSLTECAVSLVSGIRQDWADMTGLGHLWGDSPSDFFGSNLVDYTYYGSGVERYMIMDDWRALRADWPEDSMMLWQWSFTNKNVTDVSDFGDHFYVEKQVPIGVRVTAQKDLNLTGEIVPKGYTYAYTMYDFEVSPVGKNVEFNGIRVFDAYDCYSPNWRDSLRYKLDLSSWPEVITEPLITSTLLNEYWQVVLSFYGKVSPIRITRVQTIVEEGDEVWVEFVLLYRHYKIGDLDEELFRNMTTGSKARSYITAAINKGDIKYEGQRPDGQGFVIQAIPGSLTDIIEPDCTTTTSTTTTTTSTPITTSNNIKTTPQKTTGNTFTPAHHTTTTPANHRPTTTTPANHKPTTTPVGHHTTTTPSTPETTTASHNGQILYTPGDLAGLGIGMVLMGFALGAGGTFLVVAKGAHHTMMGWCKKS